MLDSSSACSTVNVPDLDARPKSASSPKRRTQARFFECCVLCVIQLKRVELSDLTGQEEGVAEHLLLPGVDAMEEVRVQIHDDVVTYIGK